MKKKYAVAFAAAFAILFSGCSSRITSVEELLVAPALTVDQSAVILAIDSAVPEKTVLKFPTSGERRSPIQFVDLDADDISEAVIFYCVPSEGGYARLAVLKKEDGIWTMASSIEGAGTDVESISVIRLESSTGRFLLVEWSSINSREHQLAAYHFENGELSLGFEEACSDILVYDLDSDGYNEFCYLTPGSAYEPFRLKFVDNVKGTFALMGECRLNAQMLSSASITAGKLADGQRAVFVDEILSDSEKATEIFTATNGRLAAVKLEEGYDIFELSRRPDDSLNCLAAFDADAVFVPSQAPPFEGIYAPERWTYWYTVNSGEIIYDGATLVDKSYGILLKLPDKWLHSSTVKRDAQSPRLFFIRDEKLGINLLSIKILEIGEDASTYLAEGYELLSRSGSYRYYIKGVCAPEDFEFVKQHFAAL
ncbi:MAG: hypothetical protein RR998_07605 [Oscillospiraceae bacterium]